MTDISQPATEPSTNPSPMTREQLLAHKRAIRNQILNAKPERRAIRIFGVDVEIVQPPLEEIMRVREDVDPLKAATDMIIRYVYVPGTDEKVFDQADSSAILKLPFGSDMQRLQDALNELTGIEINIKEQEKN